MRFVALILVTLVVGPASSYAQSREQMIEFLMREAYQRSCRMAAQSQNSELAKIPFSECMAYLIQTRGPAFRSKAQSYTDGELRTEYRRYGGP